MKKISDWTLQTECGQCGVLWEIEATDLKYEEMERGSFVGASDDGIEVETTTVPFVTVQCQNCEEEIQIGEENVPTLILEKLKMLNEDEFVDYEREYGMANT